MPVRVGPYIPFSTNNAMLFTDNAFSAGPRSCIGQRFALTESACILARLTQKYEICVPEEFRSLANRKDILLQWTPGVTLTPKNARVTLRRRRS